MFKNKTFKKRHLLGSIYRGMVLMFLLISFNGYAQKDILQFRSSEAFDAALESTLQMEKEEYQLWVQDQGIETPYNAFLDVAEELDVAFPEDAPEEKGARLEVQFNNIIKGKAKVEDEELVPLLQNPMNRLTNMDGLVRVSDSELYIIDDAVFSYPVSMASEIRNQIVGNEADFEDGTYFDGNLTVSRSSGLRSYGSDGPRFKSQSCRAKMSRRKRIKTAYRHVRYHYTLGREDRRTTVYGWFNMASVAPQRKILFGLVWIPQKRHVELRINGSLKNYHNGYNWSKTHQINYAKCKKSWWLIKTFGFNSLVRPGNAKNNYNMDPNFKVVGRNMSGDCRKVQAECTLNIN